MTGNQLIVADTSGNGTIGSFDAALIANYTVSASPSGSTGTWRFVPVNRNYASVSGAINGQDYSALLMGEVTGNWTNTGARPAVGPLRSTAVTAPRLTTPAGREVIVPISIDGAAEKGIISYEFELRYDPAVILPQSDVIEFAGTLSRRLSFAVNANEPGLLRVAVYGATALDGSGILLNLKFKAVGLPGTMTTLKWERIMLNEGDPATTAIDGQVMISPAASNQAEISGRVLNSEGQGIPNARVEGAEVTPPSKQRVNVIDLFLYLEY